MASLTDIAVDIQNKLSAIQSNTANTESAVLQVKADTGALNLKTSTLITTNQNGFFNLSQGIAELLKQQFATNQLLNHHSQQNETIICWLRTIADLLCDILRQLEVSVEGQVKIQECICLLKEIMELVHGSEAIQARAHRDLEKRIEECCPPEPPPTRPCFEPCAEPQRPPDIPRPDYNPLPRPEERPDQPSGGPG